MYIQTKTTAAIARALPGVSPIILMEGQVWEFVAAFLAFYLSNRLTLLWAFLDSHTGLHALWRTSQQAVCVLLHASYCLCCAFGALCCSVLPCVAVCCRVSPCVAVQMLCVAVCRCVPLCVAVCCCVSLYIAVSHCIASLCITCTRVGMCGALKPWLDSAPPPSPPPSTTSCPCQVWISPNHCKAVWRVLRTELPILRWMSRFEIGFAVTRKDKQAVSKWRQFRDTLSCVWPFLLFFAAGIGGITFVIVYLALGELDLRQGLGNAAAGLWTVLTMLLIWPPIATLLPRVYTSNGWRVVWRLPNEVENTVGVAGTVAPTLSRMPTVAMAASAPPAAYGTLHVMPFKSRDCSWFAWS